MQADAYHLLRGVFPGPLPIFRPTGVQAWRRKLLRNRSIELSVDQLCVVVNGLMVEDITTGAGKVATVDFYRYGDVIVEPTGTLIAATQTELVVLKGWPSHPDVKAYVDVLLAKKRAALASRLASAMVDSTTERVLAFSQVHPDISSPSQIARFVGCSREMSSRILKTQTETSA